MKNIDNILKKREELYKSKTNSKRNTKEEDGVSIDWEWFEKQFKPHEKGFREYFGEGFKREPFIGIFLIFSIIGGIVMFFTAVIDILI